MRDQFYLHFDTMPSATAQQKGVRIVHGKPMFYEKAEVKTARQLFTLELKPHAPKVPSDKPIKLIVWFAFDTKNKKLMIIAFTVKLLIAISVSITEIVRIA